MAKVRLDQLVVERGLASSREKAKALILAGAELKGRVNLINPAKTLALLKAPKSP